MDQCKLNSNSLKINKNDEVIKIFSYALLGSSGSGKTTLLSAAVGALKLNSGKIKILGNPVGVVPGHKIGYMPQQISLVNELRIKEIIFYFGRLYGMKDGKIQEQLRNVGKLLMLPDNDKFIGDCSGGEQRRVSFAVAIIHEPELLILDEPTVGLDPVLRDEIWKFLIEKSSKNNVSVIITTHYIEEAKQANNIGFIRNGSLLEDTIDNILDTFNTQSLDEAFMRFAIAQDNQEAFHKSTVIDNEIDEVSTQKVDNFEKPKRSRVMKALVYKNLVQLIRQPM